MPKYNPKHNSRHKLKPKNKQIRSSYQVSHTIPKTLDDNLNISTWQQRNNTETIVDEFDNGLFSQIELLKHILLGREQSELFGQSYSPQNIDLQRRNYENNKDSSIFQVKISIKGSKPPIWRRILIWNYAPLSEVHDLIQEYFDWDGMHLHEFRFLIKDMFKREYTIGPSYEDRDFDSTSDYDEDEIKLYNCLSMEQSRLHYTYDFGDNWDVLIKLEQIYTEGDLESYGFLDELPICIKGKGAGPPEDCGGIWGFSNILDALKTPNDPDVGNLLDWVGEDFDPTEITHEIYPVKLPKKQKHTHTPENRKGWVKNAVRLDCHTKVKAIKSSSFYSSEAEKILFNWYLFELARSIHDGFLLFVESSGRVKGFRKGEIVQNTVRIIQEKMGHLVKMSQKSKFTIPRKLLKQIFPIMAKGNLEDLFIALECSINNFYLVCRNCPCACLNHKSTHCTMFDDEVYS